MRDIGVIYFRLKMNRREAAGSGDSLKGERNGSTSTAAVKLKSVVHQVAVRVGFHCIIKSLSSDGWNPGLD
jgi:hypothetical protein